MPNVRSVLKKWQGRYSSQLHCAVMRHAERADSDSCWTQNNWALSSDGQQWPFDPPLSDRGLVNARLLASRELLPHASNSSGENEGCWVVVSSPFLRCVQTAVLVCAELGPKTLLLLDHDLGEIYGPSTMGDHEPESVLRPVEEAWSFCKAQHVRYRSQLLGRPPGWPEDMTQMRTRVLRCFLRYLRRSALARRNFVLVTHADGVGAALAAMPSIQGRFIERVEFGGLFFASASTKAGQLLGMTAVTDLVEQAEDRVEDGFIKVSEPPSPDPPLKTAGGWQVKTSGVQLGPRSRRGGLVARLRRLTQRTGFSEAEIARLLRCLPGQPLTEEAPEGQEFSQLRSVRRGQRCFSPGACSGISWSTYVFGASETDSSTWGSWLPASSSRTSREDSDNNSKVRTSSSSGGSGGRHVSPLSTSMNSSGQASRDEKMKRSALFTDSLNVEEQPSRDLSGSSHCSHARVLPNLLPLQLQQGSSKIADSCKVATYAWTASKQPETAKMSSCYEPVVCSPDSSPKGGYSPLLQRRGKHPLNLLIVKNDKRT